MRYHGLCPLYAFLLICTYCHSMAWAQGPLHVINFEDGALGQPIGNHYSQYGITFSNSLFTTPPTGFGSPTNLIALTNQLPMPNFPNSGNPIVVSFLNPVSYIEITAQDVAMFGARLDAYDALVGGQRVGRSEAEGSGAGVGVSFLLSVTQPEIYRIELYQHLQTAPQDDGLKWDDMKFRFTAVPEPRHYLFGSVVVLAGLYGINRWRSRIVCE